MLIRLRARSGGLVTRTLRLPRPLPILLTALALALATPVAASAPDWNAVADVDEVEVVTQDEDGATRETTVWLAVVDGQGYLRTSDSRWGNNLIRQPDFLLRIGEQEYPLRVEFVEDDALRLRIEDVFRKKYGFSDSFIDWFRSSRPRIMQLLPR
jgi:hypothetical protein